MSSRVRLGLSAVLLASLAVTVLTTLACSNEAVTGGAQEVTTVVRPSPSGAGRFDRALLTVTKIRVLPADPNLASLYGSQQLVLFFTPSSVSLTGTTDIPLSTENQTIALAAGAYKVTFLDVGPLALVDEDVPVSPASCIDGLQVIDGGQPAGVPTNYLFVDPPMSFTVPPGHTTVALKVNVPGLIDGYLSAYTCTPGCGPGGSGCLTAFSAATYRAALLANISFE